jgi:hypothetical protein
LTSCPLLIFADDWGRHPSSCQHLIRRLLDRHPAAWVNTIGMRPPRLDLLTMRRGLGKVRQWFRPTPASTPDLAGPRIVNPRMWPWFRSGFDRRLNRGLLLRQLAPVLAAMPEPPVAVTTLPITADLMGSLPVRRWVYYCVDDFGQLCVPKTSLVGRIRRQKRSSALGASCRQTRVAKRFPYGW